MKHTFFVLITLSLIVLTIGCTQTEEVTKYVCPSGSIVDDPSYCPEDEFQKTEYVCPDETIVEDPDECSPQYVCMNNEVVSNPLDCEVEMVKDDIKESQEYWASEANPFRIREYNLARNTIFLTMKNTLDETITFKKARFDGTPIRLGLINTTFGPGEERAVSGDVENGCELNENYSYFVTLTYEADGSEQQQTGAVPLMGDCEEMPKISLDISCTNATKETNGTLIIKNNGIESVPSNSLNFEKEMITKLAHEEIPPGGELRLTSQELKTSLISGSKGEVWMTGTSHSHFVCIK